MKYVEHISAKGTVTLDIYKHGILIEHQVINNLVVTVGKGRMAHLLGSVTPPFPVTKIAAGTNGTATSLGDTAISGGATPIGFYAITYPATGSVKFAFTFGTGDANGITIQEFGLLTTDGVLFSRLTRASIVKTSAISIVGTWEIDF
jgi:hypothetical protein